MTQSTTVRTVRMHLAIVGYLAFCCSTLYWGVRPWEDCVPADKIISSLSFAFIMQNMFSKTSDLPARLRWTLMASIGLFIYIHWVR